MGIGGPEQEVDGQAGAATEQGVDAIAAQQGTRMVCGSVTGGRIGIGSAPGQDGSTVDNQIARSHQTTPHRTPDGQDKEGLKGGRSCRLPAFAELGRAGDARLAIGSYW